MLVVLAGSTVPSQYLLGPRSRPSWLCTFYLGHHFTAMPTFSDRMVPMYASDAAISDGLVRVAIVALLFGAATALLLRRSAS